MKQLKELFAAGKSKLQAAAAPVAGTGALLIGVDAHAAYTAPAAATAAWTQMTDAFTWVETNMWTVGSTVLVGFFVFRLFKKAANRTA